MKQYAIIPEAEITAEKAAKFPVLTNFPTTYIFDSVIVLDASGQESEIIKDSTFVRWVESGESGFSTEQDSIITAAKTKFNQGRGNKPKLPDLVKGNSEFARNFNTGRKLSPK